MGSRDVIGHVTIRLLEADFLSVVHGNHVSIWHRYGDMAPQMLDARTLTRIERRKKGKKKREEEGKEREEESGKEKRKRKGKMKVKGKGRGKGR